MTEDTPNPPQPDWRDLSTYQYTRDLTREDWAWEFLRRNQDYAATAANAAKPGSRTERRMSMVTMLDATNIAEGAQAWGLHFLRGTEQPSGGFFHILAGRRESCGPSR